MLSGAYSLRVLNLAAISGVAVLGLQLIVGYTGQFSFGQGAFFGIGAYVAAILSVRYNVPCLVTLPLAAIGAGLAGLVVAPILRLSGHYLAIATLATGDIVFLLLNNLKSVTNGSYGIYGIPPLELVGFEIESDQAFFVVVSLVLVAVFFLLNRLIHSRFGRSLVAVRENELAAAACGINPARQKVLAFVIGSGCAGLAGGLYAHYVAYISPEAFDFTRSIELITMVVIGGLGSMPGGLIGAVVVVAMPEYLRFLADYRLVVYGLLLIIFMVGLPGGVVDVARRAFRLLQLWPYSRIATS
jgi:branched-chain amino acid transport system permease protein